jgi:hypothetical protein
MIRALKSTAFKTVKTTWTRRGIGDGVIDSSEESTTQVDEIQVYMDLNSAAKISEALQAAFGGESALRDLYPDIDYFRGAIRQAIAK